MTLSRKQSRVLILKFKRSIIISISYAVLKVSHKILFPEINILMYIAYRTGTAKVKFYFRKNAGIFWSMHLYPCTMVKHIQE